LKPAAAKQSAKDEPVGKVTGRVVSAADGRPIKGAIVRLAKKGADEKEFPPQRVVSDADGIFTFDKVIPGKYGLWAFHGNLSSRERMCQRESVTVAADRVSEPAVLKMRPGLTVRVKVLDQADGKPVAGARVSLVWTDMEGDRFTDASGQVELEALTAQKWH